MKHLTTLAIALALIACGPTPSPSASTPIEDATPTAETAPATSDFAAESLIGRWGDSGDCNKDVVFNADGTFHSYTGGTGQYSVDGDIITMSGDGGVFQLRARTIDARTLELTNPDSSVFVSQRC